MTVGLGDLPSSRSGCCQGAGKSPKPTVISPGFWDGQNAPMAVKIIFRVVMDEFEMLCVGIFDPVPQLRVLESQSRKLDFS